MTHRCDSCSSPITEAKTGAMTLRACSIRCSRRLVNHDKVQALRDIANQHADSVARAKARKALGPGGW